MKHIDLAVEALARDYFEEVIRGQSIDTDAFDRLVDLTASDPTSAWRVVQRLIELSATDTDLAYVGAGPLEYLIVTSPDTNVPMVVELSKSDARLRRALDFVAVNDDIPAEQLRALDAARTGPNR